MTPVQAAEQAVESRQRQGLPPCIEDQAFLAALAAELLKAEEVAPDAA